MSAETDSADTIPGGSSVSMSTVKGNDTLCFFDGVVGIALGVIWSRF